MRVARLTVVYLFIVNIFALIIGYNLSVALFFRSTICYGVAFGLVRTTLKLISKLLCGLSYLQKEANGHKQHNNEADDKNGKYKCI